MFDNETHPRDGLMLGIGTRNCESEKRLKRISETGWSLRARSERKEKNISDLSQLKKSGPDWCEIPRNESPSE